MFCFRIETLATSFLRTSSVTQITAMRLSKLAVNFTSNLVLKLSRSDLRNNVKVAWTLIWFKIMKSKVNARVTKCSLIWWSPHTRSVLTWSVSVRRISSWFKLFTSLVIFITLTGTLARLRFSGTIVSILFSRNCTSLINGDLCSKRTLRWLTLSDPEMSWSAELFFQN